jgi:hypothetical protein
MHLQQELFLSIGVGALQELLCDFQRRTQQGVVQDAALLGLSPAARVVD